MKEYRHHIDKIKIFNHNFVINDRYILFIYRTYIQSIEINIQYYIKNTNNFNNIFTHMCVHFFFIYSIPYLCYKISYNEIKLLLYILSNISNTTEKGPMHNTSFH